jgi:hypothetical protein
MEESHIKASSCARTLLRYRLPFLLFSCPCISSTGGPRRPRTKTLPLFLRQHVETSITQTMVKILYVMLRTKTSVCN